jgi:hypothetical protein
VPHAGYCLEARPGMSEATAWPFASGSSGPRVGWVTEVLGPQPQASGSNECSFPLITTRKLPAELMKNQ